MALLEESATAMAPPRDQGTEPTASPAVISVIETAELLENILLYLPLRALLCAKRVSTLFKATMAESIKIQRALFFEPLSLPTTAEIELMERHKPTIVRNSNYVRPSSSHLPAGISRTMIENPLLDEYLRYGQVVDWDDNVRNGLSLQDQSTNTALGSLLLSPADASWRRMFVVLPSAAPFFVDSSVKYPSTQDIEQDITMRSGREGLRMDTLVSIESELRREVGEVDRCYDTIQLCNGVEWALGKYQAVTVHPRYRAEVVDGICGWDVLSPDFGRGLEEHPYSAQAEEPFGIADDDLPS